MFTKRGKSNINLTKAWWVKQFLHLRGTTLKPGQKSDQGGLKARPVQVDTRELNVLTLEGPQVSDREWPTCTKEHVLN
eukprot:6029400-Prorocentrum_lima.AAC.1